MKITDVMKQWLIDHDLVAAEATDDEIRRAAADAIAGDQMDEKTFASLQKDPDADKADQFGEQFAAMTTSIVEALKTQQTAIEKMAERLDKPPVAPVAERTNVPKLPERFGDVVQVPSDTDEGPPDVRVKCVSEKYDKTTRTRFFAGRHRSGPSGTPERLYDGGTEGRRYIDEPSEFQRALAGAWVKRQLLPAMRMGHLSMSLYTEEDHKLFEYMLHNEKWAGTIGGEDGYMVKYRKLRPDERKTIFDDATSGGSSIVPNVFDDQIVTTPLTNGQLYPKVNVITIPRGSVVQGGSMQNPSESAWGADETSSIPLETTSGFISAFNTNIRTWRGCITLGRDFVQDTPVAIGDIVTQRYGEVLSQELDNVIANGNGTSQPSGAWGSAPSALTAENSATPGPWTMGDLEDLIFQGVLYAYRQNTDRNRIAYVGTEKTYGALRGIAVGASDQRRVLGMTQTDMMINEHPFAINALSIQTDAADPDTALMFGNFAHYRMYRRAGLQIEMDTSGKTLMRANEMIIVCRARYGGRLELSGYAAKMTGGPT